MNIESHWVPVSHCCTLLPAWLHGSFLSWFLSWLLRVASSMHGHLCRPVQFAVESGSYTWHLATRKAFWASPRHPQAVPHGTICTRFHRSSSKMCLHMSRRQTRSTSIYSCDAQDPDAKHCKAFRAPYPPGQQGEACDHKCYKRSDNGMKDQH